ncbi:ATP-binding protein [Streptomyces chattanoogensis]
MNDRDPGDATGRGGLPGADPLPRSSPIREAWPVVGRADELAALDAVAEEALSGRTRVVHLDGIVGSGKTTLLHSWLERADGFHVLRVRCRRLERDFAFGAVRRLLLPLIAAASDSDRRSLLGRAGNTAQRILAPDAPGRDDSSPYADAAATRLGLDDLVFGLSRGAPLLLAVDDLQWIDPPSLRWLAHLVHRADAPMILVAATTRTGERPAHGDLFNELLHPSLCRTLVLEPLSPRDVEQLVALVLGVPRPDPSFCAACHAATDGHPLFLRALLCDARRNGMRPTQENVEEIKAFGLNSLRREIGHRLCQGSKDMAELARALAILGDGIPHALLAAYCGKGEAVVWSAAGRLHASGLLRAGDPLRFVHPVVRGPAAHRGAHLRRPRPATRRAPGPP